MTHTTDYAESPRERATHRVMRSLPKVLLNNGLAIKNEDGVSRLVVVLPDDTVQEMEERRLAMGGNATVIVAYPDHMVVIPLLEGERGDTAEIYPTSEMSMLIEWLRTPTSTGSFRLRAPKHAKSILQEHDYAF